MKFRSEVSKETQKEIDNLKQVTTVMRALAYTEAINRVRDEMKLDSSAFVLAIATCAASARATWPEIFEAANAMSQLPSDLN